MSYAESQNDSETFGPETVIALYRAALQYIGAEWLSSALWSKYFSLIKDVYDDEFLQEELAAFESRGKFVKDYRAILEANGRLPHGDAPSASEIEAQGLERLLEKRSFFHYKPLDVQTRSAIKQLVRIYQDYRQHIRLYYVAFADEELRGAILSRLMARIQEPDVRKFIDFHLETSVHQGTLLIDWQIRAVVQQSCEGYVKYAMTQNAGCIIGALRFAKACKLEYKQFQPEILELVKFQTQGEAKILSYFIEKDEELIQIIKQFNVENCDALVISLLQHWKKSGSWNQEIFEMFEGTPYEDLVREIGQEIEGQWFMANSFTKK